MPNEDALAVLELVSTCQSKSRSITIPSRMVKIFPDRVDQIGETDVVEGDNAVVAAVVAAADSIVVDDDNTEIDVGGGVGGSALNVKP